ncbi:MAG TPA: OmpW family outer membrane protein [Ideonella sp.]|uniref:OmpW/AlkL family protein n=1 Tax=Ideonella sp. TaxID=1929293 RepID=UPI002B6FA52B|nr:OmpW family outer membrane protein [Ideonella sp.]HSI50430.1 OmpW family outer membrane protein [Ideonella sp.]
MTSRFQFPSLSTSLRAAVLAVLAMTGQAHAADADTGSGSMLDGWSFYLGGAYIDVHAKSSPLSGTSTTFPDGSTHAARFRIDDASTVGFGLVYRFNKTWSGELALGLPPEHSIHGDDLLQSFGQITLVKQAPPTAFLNYHFPEVAEGVSFFVGPGINYTRFLRARNTAAGNAAAGGETKVKLDPSWGLAGHVGGTWQIDRNWSFVGTVAYAHVASTQTSTTQTNLGDGPVTVTHTANINFRPVVYSLSLGYSF